MIPARAESRRLPGKNRRLFNGLPLWEHSYIHANNAGCDPIAVSTDDPLIQPFGCIRIEQPKFPQTYNVMLEVVRHADETLHQLGFDHDAICLLQPTSPLRTAEDVQACIALLADSKGCDSIVSVTEGANDIAFQVRHAGRLEKLPEIVVPNGAIYIIRTEALRNGESWYSAYAYAYRMPKNRSIDIDTEWDLEIAQAAHNAISAGR